MTAAPRSPLDRDTLGRILRAIHEAWLAGASEVRISFGRGDRISVVRSHAQAISLPVGQGPEAA